MAAVRNALMGKQQFTSSIVQGVVVRKSTGKYVTARKRTWAAYAAKMAGAHAATIRIA